MATHSIHTVDSITITIATPITITITITIAKAFVPLPLIPVFNIDEDSTQR